MKCPKCGEEMEEGYVYLLIGRGTALYWSKEEPPYFWERLTHRRKEESLLKWGWGHMDKKDWMGKGSRCKNCKLVTFEY